MTAPTPNLRETKREQAQARKTAPKKAPATVAQLPVAEEAAAKQQHPAGKATPAKKAQATTRVAPLPKDQWKLPQPAKLTWDTKEVKGEETWVAEGKRHLYRVWHGESGWVAAQKLKQGSLVPMAGLCKRREDAQTLAGFNEAGATWLSYRDVVGTTFEALLQQYGASK